MKAFKHWKSVYAEAFTERGKLRLMPMSFYRRIEDERPGVQDRLENAVLMGHKPTVFDAAPTAAEARQLAAFGIRLGNVRGLTVSGNAVITQGPDSYLFCMTTIETPGVFCAEDSVTEIPDVLALGEAILKASAGKLTRMAGNIVTYQPVEFLYGEPRLNPSPFVKAPRFSHQKEVRLIFEPRSGVEGEVNIESMLLVEAIGLRQDRRE